MEYDHCIILFIWRYQQYNEKYDYLRLQHIQRHSMLSTQEVLALGESSASYWRQWIAIQF